MPAALCKPFIAFAALAVLAGSVYPAVGADFAIPVEGVGVEQLVVDPVLMAELPRQQLDASDHGKPILLADRRDGEPLFEETGPLQLVVGDEARSGRWIRQIERIEIVDPTARQ